MQASNCETTVIVVDGFEDAVSRTLIYDPWEKARFADLLNDSPAPLLEPLQRHDVFRGRTRWSSLDHTHFRTLVALHLSLVADLRPQDRSARTHPVMKSLDHLMLAFILHLERRMDGHATSIVITRLSRMDCRYAVTTLLGSDTYPPPRPHGLRVVVDNSKT